MRYIIIGAVAGGASTAARLRRIDEHAEILIFERGEHISYANCGLPYYIGEVIKDRSKLFVQNAVSFAKRFDVDIRISTEVTFIDKEEKTVTAFDLKTGNEYKESYDKLILSPGAKPVRPKLPGIDLPGIFTLRNVEDTDYIKEYLKISESRRAVLVGAGFIGIEMAENLHKLGLRVDIIEKEDQILAPLDFTIAAFVQQHIRSEGITLHLKTSVTGFKNSSGGISVLLDNKEIINTDVVILSIGVRPETELARKAGLKVGEAGGICVNTYLQTSDPDIYAVGDAIEFPDPITQNPAATFLAGPANKQGRICANNVAFGNLRPYSGSIGTAIIRAFNLTTGCAGASAKALAAAGIPHIVSTIHCSSHASYYPGADLMTIQITFSPGDGTLLGAQIVGGEGVDKRLDVLSSVISRRGTVFELTEFEHAYAPPFSSAKDPVNMAGFVAENILLDGLGTFQWSDLPGNNPKSLLIDVRTPAEYASGTIEGAVNTPLDDLRRSVHHIPEGKELYVFCQQGMRGYLAQRILIQKGFKAVYNLSGGYLLWNTCMKERNELTNQVL